MDPLNGAVKQFYSFFMQDEHHKKNNNYDSVKVVEDSLELMESFKLELLSYGIWMVDINVAYEES